MTGDVLGHETLVEVWRITERRNGAVFKTELVGERWVPFMEKPDADHIYVPPSRPQFRRVTKEKA